MNLVAARITGLEEENARLHAEARVMRAIIVRIASARRGVANVLEAVRQTWTPDSSDAMHLKTDQVAFDLLIEQATRQVSTNARLLANIESNVTSEIRREVDAILNTANARTRTIRDAVWAHRDAETSRG